MIAETASACPRCGAIFLKPRTSAVAVGLYVPHNAIGESRLLP